MYSSYLKARGGNVKCWGYISPSAVGSLVFIEQSMTGEACRDILQKKFI